MYTIYIYSTDTWHAHTISWPAGLFAQQFRGFFAPQIGPASDRPNPDNEVKPGMVFADGCPPETHVFPCFSWFCYSSTVHSRKWFELIILNSSLAHIKSQSPTMLPVILLFLANALRVQFSLGMPMMLEDCCMTSIRKYTKRSRVLETMLFDNSNGNKPMWNPRPLLKWARFSFLATLLILLLAFALEKLGVMTANVSPY